MSPRRSLLRGVALAAAALVGLGAATVAVMLGTPAARAERALEARIEARARLACPNPQAMPEAPPGTAIPAAARTGQLLVAHDRAGDASVIDLETGTVTYIEIGLQDPHEAAVSSDGRWGILTDFGRHDRSAGTFDGNRAAVIDMTAKRVRHMIDLGTNRGAHGVAFVPGTSRAVITTQSSRTAVVVDAEAGTVLGAIGTEADGSHLVAISPDGRSAFTVNEGDGTVSHLDLGRLTFVAEFPVDTGHTEGIGVAAGGRELWVGNVPSGTVRVLDAEAGTQLDTLDGFANAGRIYTSNDGRRALVSDPRCGMWIVDVPERRRLGAIGDAYAGGAGFLAGDRVAFAVMRGRRAAVGVFDLEKMHRVASYPLRSGSHGTAWGPKP